MKRLYLWGMGICCLGMWICSGGDSPNVPYPWGFALFFLAGIVCFILLKREEGKESGK